MAIEPEDGTLAKELRAIARGEKALPRSEAKRQHFVPRFLLDGFSDRPGQPGGRIVQLDVRSGQPRAVQPAHAASRRRCYSMFNEVGERDDQVESVLALVESHAADALERLIADPTALSAGDRQTVSIFLALQGPRTPGGLRQMAASVGTMSDTMIETITENFVTFRHHLEQAGLADEMSDEEIEARRRWMIRAHDEGRIKMTNVREQALELMLSVCDDVASMVYALQWTVVTAGEGEFITSDRPLSMVDPTPPFPWSGNAWQSSPQCRTHFPLSPQTCLVIEPGPPAIGRAQLDARGVRTVNFATYGWADRHIFGRTQQVVTDLRRAAKRAGARIPRPRPNLLVVLEEADPDDPDVGRENAARGWPRGVWVDGEDGTQRFCAYRVMPAEPKSVDLAG